MEQRVEKKESRPPRRRRQRGPMYWILWLVLSALALTYTLPFLLIGGLCGLMLFARNRMDGAFAWRNRVVRKYSRLPEEEVESDGSSGQKADN